MTLKTKSKIAKFTFVAALLSFVFCTEKARAQTTPTGQVPDCIFYFNFTANGSQPTLGYANYPASGVNGGGICTTWLVTYRAFSIVGAPSLTFQSANAASLNTAGAFGAFPGTIVLGVDPNTSSTGAQTVYANNATVSPFVRVTLTGLTSGTIAGAVYGYKTGYTGGSGTGGSGCPGTLATPCDVQGLAAAGAALAGNPVRVGIGAQGNSQDILSCPNTVIVDDSTMGNVQIIAASGATKVYICKMTFTAAASVSIQLTQGTGANCVVGTANLSGLYQSAITVAEDFGADFTWLTSAASQAVCVNLSSGTRVTGAISYAQN